MYQSAVSTAREGQVSEFTVANRVLIHESGTKFYQGWSIASSDGKSVNFTQWGKVPNDGKYDFWFGQHKRMEDATALILQLDKKQGRGGYRDVDNAARTKGCDSLDELRVELEERKFRDDLIRAILQELGGKHEDEGDDIEPAMQPSDTANENQSWGTW